MYVIPPALDRLIQELNRLPGIGKKTATRLALYILRRPAAEAMVLARSLSELHSTIKLCSSCYVFSATDPCHICGDSKRNSSQVCVVEEPADLIAIEKTGSFRGVLVATRSTVPGEATASYLLSRLERENVRVTRLACGIPMGMDIKYADAVTLAKAIESRREA
jgi:recombination protein RecR